MTRKVPLEEKQFLDAYKPGEEPRPGVAVDLVVFTIIDARLVVLLARRKEHPFKGAWVVPGGFLKVGPSATEQGEDLDAAARRQFKEKTGLDSERVHLEQLLTFGKALRDPRLRVITVAYVALVRPDLAPIVKVGGEASETKWVSIDELKRLELGFDHRDIVTTALGRVRAQVELSDIAFDLVPLTFTIPELRNVHAIVLDKTMDPGNFRRKFNRMLEDGLIEQAPGKRITTSKPATVYRFKRR